MKNYVLRVFSLSAVFLLIANLQIRASATVIVSEASQQGITITGTVTDEDGQPLPGASVMIKGTGQGTVTNVDGIYELQVPNENTTLTFSFIGFSSQELTVGNRRRVDVTLRESVQLIDEVVVVGYGQQKRATLTGSVSQVSGEEIVARPSTSVSNSLQGMMPGVTVLRTTGQPGSESSGLRIRGFTSVNSSGAMILIDGVEGSLTNLNPDDVESISVLKDAAASIYGARAAGGVVLVTTKKGSPQRLNINYNGSYGISVPGLMPQRMPPWEEQFHILESRINALDIIEFPEDFSEWLANPNYMRDIHPSAGNRYQSAIGNSNWILEGLNKYTTAQRHALSLRGGHGKTNYFLSVGYYNQNGLFKYGPDSNDRYNMRVNIGSEMNNYIDFNFNAAYEYNITYRNSVDHQTIMEHLYTARGRENMYLPEDDINYAKDPYSSDLWANPIRTMKFAGTDTNNQYYVNAAANIHIKNIVKGLTIDLNASRRFGIRSSETDRIVLWGQGRNGRRGDTYDINTPNSDVEKLKNTSTQDKLEILLNYKLTVDNHSFAVMAGASYEHWMRDQIDVRARDLLSDELFSFNFFDSSDVNNMTLSDEIYEWKMASLFSRINYDFKNRYLVEFIARYDGSSRLKPGSRFGFFPGVSGGWVLSEESFFEGAKTIVNFLKLRASYGQVGNSNAISSFYYPHLGMIARGGNYWGSRLYYRSTMPSTDVKWETVINKNIAADISFLNRRLNLSGEYFWKTNQDMLSTMAPGNIVGVENVPRENVGTLKVWGWETSASWRDKIGNVNYNVSFNLSDSKNKLVEYKGINAISAGNVANLEGYPLQTLWGYQTAGFWNSRQEYLDYKEANPGYMSYDQDGRISGGDVRYVAQGKADHRIGSIGGGTPDDPGDLIYLGDSSPHYEYGINLGAQWKNFDFTCFFQGIGKRSFFIRNLHLTPMGGSAQMPWTINRDYWREDNKDAYFARLFEAGTHNYQYADRWIQNGAYIRLKTIQLGYTVPISRFVQSLRVYFSGNDIWEHTNMLKAWDPEVGTRSETGSGDINNRIGRNYYPFMRTWTAGINLTL